MEGIKYLGLFAFAFWVLQGCGNPFESGSSSIDANQFPFGRVPVFSSSLNDYRDKVSDFDDRLNSGDYRNPVRLDPDGGYGDYQDESPFDFETPAKDSMGDATNYAQLFRNLKEIMDYGLVLGNLRMMVSVSGQSGSTQQSINSLILPPGFKEEDLIGQAELVAPPTGYSYVTSVEPEVFCSLAEVRSSDGGLENLSTLLSFDDMEEGDQNAGAPHCPVVTREINYEAQDGMYVDLQVKTNPLPRYESSRRSIDALANYGFKDQSEYALIYELKFETKNSAGTKFYMIYTFYYIIVPIVLTPPSQLGSYKYVGSYGGHEYYLLESNMPFTAIRQQATLIQTALGASKAYGVDFNSAGEQSFIASKVSAGLIPSRYVWIGYDDMQTEGTFVPHSGAPAFAARAGTPRASRFQNWYDDSEPNNDDGNEDGIHMNFGPPGKWNDKSVRNSFPVLIEAEFSTQNANLR